MKVEYHPAIEAEVRAIQAYYKDRSPGLGRQFIDEFERQVSPRPAASGCGLQVHCEFRPLRPRRSWANFGPRKGTTAGKENRLLQ